MVPDIKQAVDRRPVVGSSVVVQGIWASTNHGIHGFQTRHCGH